jgi:AbrB family looped-hinge helix DNA binding protein
MPWAKILRSGQVTLPKEVRERLNLKEGDILDFEIKEDGVVMRAKELVNKQPTPEGLEAFGRSLDQLRAATAGKFSDMTEEEVLAFVDTAVQEVRRKSAVKTKAAGVKTAAEI